MQYKCISVDDHVYESPDAYQKRLPKKLREQGPKILTGDGYEAWVIEDHIRAPIGGLGAVAGRKFEDYSPEPVPGGYGDVPKAYWGVRMEAKVEANVASIRGHAQRPDGGHLAMGGPAVAEQQGLPPRIPRCGMTPLI